MLLEDEGATSSVLSLFLLADMFASKLPPFTTGCPVIMVPGSSVGVASVPLLFLGVRLTEGRGDVSGCTNCEVGKAGSVED